MGLLVMVLQASEGGQGPYRACMSFQNSPQCVTPVGKASQLLVPSDPLEGIPHGTYSPAQSLQDTGIPEMR